jgi:hypothetical protein
MITSSVRELNSTKAKVAKLEQALARELASLPAAYGFDSLKEFASAIKAAGGGGKRAKRPRKAAAPKKRKRAKITDAVRAKVKALVKAGKSGSTIAEALGISLPSVRNIKSALGLVNKREKAATRTRHAKARRKAAPKARKAPKKGALSASKAFPATPLAPSGEPMA